MGCGVFLTMVCPCAVAQHEFRHPGRSWPGGGAVQGARGRFLVAAPLRQRGVRLVCLTTRLALTPPHIPLPPLISYTCILGRVSVGECKREERERERARECVSQMPSLQVALGALRVSRLRGSASGWCAAHPCMPPSQVQRLCNVLA